MDRIDHGASYSLPGGIYANGAEGFFSRLRRAELRIGVLWYVKLARGLLIRAY